jgi:hypothetical protein
MRLAFSYGKASFTSVDLSQLLVAQKTSKSRRVTNTTIDR